MILGILEQQLGVYLQKISNDKTSITGKPDFILCHPKTLIELCNEIYTHPIYRYAFQFESFNYKGIPFITSMKVSEMVFKFTF